MSQFKAWALDAGERAVRTAAQTALAALGADVTDYAHLPWVHVAVISGAAAGISLLTSIAGAQVGDKSSASVLPASAEPPAA